MGTETKCPDCGSKNTGNDRRIKRWNKDKTAREEVMEMRCKDCGRLFRPVKGE